MILDLLDGDGHRRGLAVGCRRGRESTKAATVRAVTSPGRPVCSLTVLLTRYSLVEVSSRVTLAAAPSEAAGAPVELDLISSLVMTRFSGS